MSPLSSPRVALAALALLGAAAASSRTTGEAQAATPVREIEIVVDGGYRPSRIEVAEGERVRLVFVRRDYTPCTREVVFPALDLRRELPTDERVAVELGPLAPGEYGFECGMRMIRGTLVVRGRS